MQHHRSLGIVAREIWADWKKPDHAAVPYISAMGSLDQITDNYYLDSAHEIVLRFLCNAGKWRGEKAREIKAELKAIVKAFEKQKDQERAAFRKRVADRIDGYDRDDLGESPDF